MSNLHYSWKRFWCPRDGTYSISDNGYLYDPDSEYGDTINPFLAPLKDFEDAACLILLGEPGVGKSTEFTTELSRVTATEADSRHVCHSIDLKEYQTDTLLVSDIFDAEVMQDWFTGSHVLYLFLDSLDEGHLEVRNIASILAGRLRRLQPYAHRLRLRIACRTAEWPTSLEQTLKDIWAEDHNLQVLELVPLRRSDVRQAAEKNSIDPDEFLKEVSRVSAEAFAVNPISLNFLLNIYSQSDTLPTTKYELFEAGCRFLCDEVNQSRRDAGHFGQLTAAERLEIVSRVAAMMVFSGKSVINTSIHPKPGDQNVTIAEFAGGFELLEDRQINVNESSIREVLCTTLFSGRGSEQLGFAHRTYAEFLAGWYITHHKLDQPQVHSLLFHPEYDTRIIPQLAETAAWVAVKDNFIFETMLNGDPQTLLRSDVATADETTKKRLVSRLLQGFRSGDLDDSDWALREHYHKLRHSDLADQLTPVLQDKNETTLLRRFAADLAEECKTSELLDVLLDVALDEFEDTYIRSQVAHAIVRIDEEDALAKLKPLAMGNLGDDPDDSLRGIALSGMWKRRLLSAKELFSSIERPQNYTFFGEYRHFLQFELPNNIHREDLVYGLEWCAQQKLNRGYIDDFEEAATAIVSLSLNHLDLPGVIEALAVYIHSRAIKHNDLGITSHAFDQVSDQDRRKIIEAVIPRFEDIEKQTFTLIGRHPILIQENDLDWILNISANAPTLDEQTRLAELAKQRFLFGSCVGLDLILHHCESNPVIADVFADLVQPVDLNSPIAREMQERYARTVELEERMLRQKSSRLVDPPPKERVESCLHRFESGDLEGWWQANRELQLESDSPGYLHEHIDDITQFPGWEAADDLTHQRLIKAAKKYLIEWKSQPHEWLGTNIRFFPDLAGYRAFVLIEIFEPEFLSSLTCQRWANLVPSIMGFPLNPGVENDSLGRQQRILAMAYAKVPEIVIQYLLTLIEQVDSQNENPNLYSLQCIKDCHDQRISSALSQKVRDRSLKANSVVQIIEHLFDRDPAAAESLANLLFLNGRAISQSMFCRAFGSKNRKSPNTQSKFTDRFSKRRRHTSFSQSQNFARQHKHRRLRAREISRKLAIIIWLNSSNRWNTLWHHFKKDRPFFRKVFSEIAYHGRQARIEPSFLTEAQLSEVFITLSEEFPHSSDITEQGAHHTSPRENVQYYRDSILTMLRDRGSKAAILAIEQIRQRLPHLDYLEWLQRAAHKSMLQATWQPNSVAQLKEFISRQKSRLVRSERELQKVVLESLERLQQQLHDENPAVRDIWDHDRTKNKWVPVDENAFSDYIVRHLKTDLKRCGIVALREVEIRRGNDGPGERTDIYVTAQILGPQPGTWESVRLIIEVKGCWHQELKTAMNSQLKQRYLKDNDCEHGIYVVGWFACDSWDNNDTRKGKTQKWNITKAREFFITQSKDVSDTNNVISSFVLDSSLK